jgi:hypothetical protein
MSIDQATALASLASRHHPSFPPTNRQEMRAVVHFGTSLLATLVIRHLMVKELTELLKELR